MRWFHRYRPVDIGTQEVIHEHTPGRKIAEAITELQEKVVADIAAVNLSGLVTLNVTREGNQVVLTIDDLLPEGGEQYQVLQRDSGGNAVWDWVRAH